jgi:hypothetical protein
MSDEAALLLQHQGLTVADLLAMGREAATHSFLSDEDRAEALEQLRAAAEA